jgi:apolipoprotein D and lipocalin family protein
MKRLLIAAALAIAAPLAAVAEDAAAPLTTIESLDVPRYMGRWHEIARYPNRFQKQCVGESSADYQLLADNTVRVTNRCRLADGRMNEAIGRARQLGRHQLESALCAGVAVLPAAGVGRLLEWWDRRRLPVGGGHEPSRRFLWVLARKPALDARTEAGIRARLVARGFDPDRLVSGRQDDGGDGAGGPQPGCSASESG